MLRIARDLPSTDPDHVAFLEARLSVLMKQSDPVDAERLAKLASWCEPEMHACLLSAPEELRGKAEDGRLSYNERLVAGSSAFAFMLMWEHCAFQPNEIADFDVRECVGVDSGKRCVFRRDRAGDVGPSSAMFVPEAMSPETCSIYDRLMAVRENVSVVSSILLPGRDGKPREVRAAMDAIYNQIQSVVGERVTAMMFKDLNNFISLDAGADIAEVAAGSDYSEARSLERRLGTVVKKPKDPQ